MPCRSEESWFSTFTCHNSRDTGKMQLRRYFKAAVTLRLVGGDRFSAQDSVTSSIPLNETKYKLEIFYCPYLRTKEDIIHLHEHFREMDLSYRYH